MMNPVDIARMITEDPDIIQDSVTLYRTDPAISDPEEIRNQIESGTYRGRYFTNKKEDALGYYPGHPLIVVQIRADDLVVDGYGVSEQLLLGEVESSEEYIRDALQEIPNQFHREFIEVMGKNDDDIPHYSGALSRDRFDLLKRISRVILLQHLENHGQVALLGRSLRPEELVSIE